MIGKVTDADGFMVVAEDMDTYSGTIAFKQGTNNGHPEFEAQIFSGLLFHAVKTISILKRPYQNHKEYSE